MPDLSEYKSRTGKLSCTPAEMFDFVTDIRNFKQFVPEGAIDDLQVDMDSCSFHVSPLGRVSFSLSEKKPHSRVVFKGTVLQSNDFSMIIDIMENIAGRAEATLHLAAHLNPLLKMMAAKPIAGFLEKLIDEMEKFRGWQTGK